MKLEKREKYKAPLMEPFAIRSLHLLESLSVKATFEDIDFYEPSFEDIDFDNPS